MKTPDVKLHGLRVVCELEHGTLAELTLRDGEHFSGVLAAGDAPGDQKRLLPGATGVDDVRATLEHVRLYQDVDGGTADMGRREQHLVHALNLHRQYKLKLSWSCSATVSWSFFILKPWKSPQHRPKKISIKSILNLCKDLGRDSPPLKQSRISN